MVFSKIKINRCEVDVIFSGAQYIFQNSDFGIVCVANRLSYEKPVFELLAGNSQCLGSQFTDSLLFAAAKRFIDKIENKYIKAKVEYTEKNEDLSAWSMEIKAFNRNEMNK